MSAIKDPSVRVYVVWVPILATDRDAPPPETRDLVPDERASHFWDAQGVLPGSFASTLGLRPNRPAWDVYLIYRRGIRWEKAPPRPAYWEHQLGVTIAPRLNGQTFAAHLRDVLRPRQRGELGTRLGSQTQHASHRCAQAAGSRQAAATAVREEAGCLMGNLPGMEKPQTNQVAWAGGGLIGIES